MRFQDRQYSLDERRTGHHTHDPLQHADAEARRSNTPQLLHAAGSPRCVQLVHARGTPRYRITAATYVQTDNFPEQAIVPGFVFLRTAQFTPALPAVQNLSTFIILATIPFNCIKLALNYGVAVILFDRLTAAVPSLRGASV